MTTLINGILLIYHHRIYKDASTIKEHVSAFGKHSRFKVWSVNTEQGFPAQIESLEFQVILLHYSLFGLGPFLLPDDFLAYIQKTKTSYKIAFLQDEHQYWPKRSEFLNHYKIDCVYTLLEPEFLKDTYQKHSNVPKYVYNLPGYVSDELIKLGKKFTKPDKLRKIDIGYRGRVLPFNMGMGAQEKAEIGIRFMENAAGLGLNLDIEIQEKKRIYGKKWYQFLANCRAVLGVETGVSVFDIDNIVYPAFEQLIARNPIISFDEVYNNLLIPHENKIYYRTIGPRHFEASALFVTQILYEGNYSGIMKPMVHYIPLKKDFSNFDDVIYMFKDKALRLEIIENAYRDLIASNLYSYRRFMDGFDQELLGVGLEPAISEKDERLVTGLLRKAYIRGMPYRYYNFVRYQYEFRGRSFIYRIYRNLRNIINTINDSTAKKSGRHFP
jgi:hypothetical protein